MQMIPIEKHLEEIQCADGEIDELKIELSELKEDYEDLKQEYADFRLRANKMQSALRNICESTIKEDEKIKRDCKIITVLSFILVMLVIVLVVL